MVPPMGEVLPLGCPFYHPSSALQGWVPLCQLQFLSQHQPECSPGLEFLLSNRLVHHLLIQLEWGSQAFIRRKKPDSWSKCYSNSPHLHSSEVLIYDLGLHYLCYSERFLLSSH